MSANPRIHTLHHRVIALGFFVVLGLASAVLFPITGWLVYQLFYKEWKA